MSRIRGDMALGVIVIGLALAGVPDIRAGDEPARAAAPAVLFDGRSLDGWKPLAGKSGGTVAAADGAITLGAGDPMTGATSTRADLPKVDYSLKFEARRTKGNDFFAAATFPVEESFVTLVTGGWGGSVTGLSLINGASAVENATNHFVKYQNDTWYAFEVQVTAKVIRCRVDGKEVFAFDHRDTQLTTRIETRGNQPLGFASYRSTGQIRRVEVRPLSAAEIAEVDARADAD